MPKRVMTLRLMAAASFLGVPAIGQCGMLRRIRDRVPHQ
jgi:hypothetical protein